MITFTSRPYTLLYPNSNMKMTLEGGRIGILNCVDFYDERHGNKTKRSYVNVSYSSALINGHTLTRKTARPWVTAALNIIGEVPNRFHFNQKAGCACGCSPGYIIEAKAPWYLDLAVYADEADYQESVKLQRQRKMQRRITDIDREMAVLNERLAATSNQLAELRREKTDLEMQLNAGEY
jgi:hypothetical protein